MIRASSFSARAGMIARIGPASGDVRWEDRTDSRNPSAAASVITPSLISASTPVSTGRASSPEAAKATWLIISPGSSILAPIQHVIPNSRLVADRRSRPSSVAISTFPRTGKVLRGATALATLPRARDRFSWRQETFIVYEPLGDRLAD